MVLLFYMTTEILANISVKFDENILHSFKLPSGHEYMTEITIYAVQRATIPKEGYSQLRFLFSACHLKMLKISVKFHENISNCFRVTDQT